MRCAAGSPTLTLSCTPLTGRCGDVYPVAVALFRQGSSTPLGHFTTFLTYQEPTAVGGDGALRVALVLPVAGGSTETMANTLLRRTATSPPRSPSARSPRTRSRVTPRAGDAALAQLDGDSTDEVLDQSYVPINLAALSKAGIAGEIGAQMIRGDDLLRAAGLKPVGGAWIDSATSFAQGDGGDLAAGLRVAGASQLVLNDADLAPGGLSNLTFAQPFTLDLGQGSNVLAAAVNSTLSARFTANRADQVLSAEQLLAGMSFVHFENAFLTTRGVVIEPPAGWQPSGSLPRRAAGGLSGNQVLSAVSLGQFFDQVPTGGNRRAQRPPPPVGPGHPGPDARRSRQDRPGAPAVGLVRRAVEPDHPPEMTSLADALLATEARGLTAARRSAALTAYEKAFSGVTGTIRLGTEQTVTFTATRAAIPVTVLSDAPYPVRVVVTLASDKFTFPDGNTTR